MHTKDVAVLLFIVLLFFIMALGMIQPALMLTGGATALVEPVCASTADCAPEKTCCSFSESEYGVCDLEENCPVIAQVTPYHESPQVLSASPRGALLYSTLFGLFVAVLVIIVVFYKKSQR